MKIEIIFDDGSKVFSYFDDEPAMLAYAAELIAEQADANYRIASLRFSYE